MGCSVMRTAAGIADFPGEDVVVVLARPVRAAGLAGQIITQNWNSTFSSANTA
jgi:hypothetical protein